MMINTWFKIVFLLVTITAVFWEIVNSSLFVISLKDYVECEEIDVYPFKYVKDSSDAIINLKKTKEVVVF